MQFQQLDDPDCSPPSGWSCENVQQPVIGPPVHHPRVSSEERFIRNQVSRQTDRQTDISIDKVHQSEAVDLSMIVIGPGLLWAAVALPLATLALSYAVARPVPEYPTFFPSAIFSRGEPPRIVASLGFGGLSMPFMVLLGVVRHLRDQQRCGEQRSWRWLRSGTFACVLLGLQGAASIPYPVNRPMHGFAAALFFVAAALDLLFQLPLQRQLSGAFLGAPRVLGVVLCILSVLGQLTGNRPLMSFGELGFAILYLGILALEVRELSSLRVELVLRENDVERAPLDAPLSGRSPNCDSTTNQPTSG
eukprot:SAG31_NODE_597_length_13674_cov_3.402947_18_plen_305_part_00